MVGLAFALSTVQVLVRQGDWAARVRTAFWVYWRPAVAFAIPVALGAIISLWWNSARFGSLWDTGYVESETFSANWLVGLFGLTAGPPRGFIWYNPILLLAIPGQRLVLAAPAAASVPEPGVGGAHFAVYAKWYMWHGG